MTERTALSSMTGFGAATAETEIGRLTVEARSWNNRFLEFTLRTPREFNALDARLRELIKKKISRGKIELSIRWQPTPDLAASISIDAKALERHARAIREVQRRLNDDGPLPMEYLLQLPGVEQANGGEGLSDDALWPPVQQVAGEALERLNAERRREAEALGEDMRARVRTLRELSRTVESGRGEAEGRLRDKLNQRFEEWRQQTGVPIESARMEAEILFYLDRLDIQEEIVRLNAHLDKFDAALSAPKGPVGKSLDFLCQELLRETNTIGSKARDTSVTNAVMEMKGLIETLREQTQNLE